MTSPRKFPKLQPYDLKRLGKTQQNPQAAPVRETAAKETPVYLTRGFWREWPWAQRAYYVNDAYEFWPGPAAILDLLVEQVPQHLVLAVTSVVFRATIATGVHATDVMFARDSYLYQTGRFFIEVNGQLPYDRRWSLAPANVIFNGTSILNQEQAVPGVPYFVFATSGEALRIRLITIGVLPAGFVAPTRVGVEVRGIWVPKVVFDKFRAEMEV